MLGLPKIAANLGASALPDAGAPFTGVPAGAELTPDPPARGAKEEEVAESCLEGLDALSVSDADRFMSVEAERVSLGRRTRGRRAEAGAGLTRHGSARDETKEGDGERRGC